MLKADWLIPGHMTLNGIIIQTKNILLHLKNVIELASHIKLHLIQYNCLTLHIHLRSIIVKYLNLLV